MSAIPIKLPRELAEGVCEQCGSICYREGDWVICDENGHRFHIGSFTRELPDETELATRAEAERLAALAKGQNGGWSARGRTRAAKRA